MKAAAADDPMELKAVRLPQGDPRAMARCVVEEYSLLGWDERQLMQLFTRPCFRATHGLYLALGEQAVRGVIEEVRARWSGARVENGARHA